MRPIRTSAALPLLLLLMGCQRWNSAPGPLFNLPIYKQRAVQATTPNPVFVPVADPTYTWEQIVDVVDDYFRVESERRVELVGDVITEGTIVTYPRIGSTIVEPHRRDSVGRFNRWQSTLQTIRRSAIVRVLPEPGGYLVQVTVQKELEDLPRPEGSPSGAASLRNDNSLNARSNETVSPLRLSGSWIPLGRDPALEQRMLEKIRERLTAEH